jgi:predicted transcriptional regulator
MHTDTLADPARLQQFALLCGTARPLRDHTLVKDQDGVVWACARIAGQIFAVPADRLTPDLGFGPIAERLLWLIHHEVRVQRVREIRLSRAELRQSIWGSSAHRNWLLKLRKALGSISKLRVGEWDKEKEEDKPLLEHSLPLFEVVNDDKDAKEFIFIIGEGFLGSLEQFADQDQDDGSYKFPGSKKLKELRKANQIVDVYLPIYLGDPAACRQLSPRQKRLLQAVIRELTFPPRDKQAPKKQPVSRSLSNGALIRSDLISGFNSKGTIECPCLDPDMNYVGFNGNGVRRGQGYKLATWRDKAGYGNDETQRFLNDLHVVSSYLGLIVGAVGKSDGWCSQGRLRIMSREPTCQRRLAGLHVRVYARADYIERWNQKFCWSEAADPPSVSKTGFEVMDNLREVMAEKGIQQQQVARELGVTRQSISKMLKLNRCSVTLKQRIEEFIDRITKQAAASDRKPIQPPEFELVKVRIKKGSPAMLDKALSYLDKGWSVIPIRSWQKSKEPCVKWKPYQDELPSREKVIEWWTKWPDAGIAVVLGPVSNLLCVDVDGEIPYRILLDVIGEIPMAPTVKSGSDDPFRYHFYFRCPEDVETGASTTPWNRQDDENKLELRGHKGLLVLPPSLHKSGRQYNWVKGRTMDDVPLPELPQPLLDGLKKCQTAPETPAPQSGNGETDAIDINGLRVAKSTAEFLAGKHAEANGSWSNLLFKAACDLCARGIPLEKAEPLVLKGARPRSPDDEQAARESIASAYSEQRSPSLY